MLGWETRGRQWQFRCKSWLARRQNVNWNAGAAGTVNAERGPDRRGRDLTGAGVGRKRSFVLSYSEKKENRRNISRSSFFALSESQDLTGAGSGRGKSFAFSKSPKEGSRQNISRSCLFALSEFTWRPPPRKSEARIDTGMSRLIRTNNTKWKSFSSGEFWIKRQV